MANTDKDEDLVMVGEGVEDDDPVTLRLDDEDEETPGDEQLGAADEDDDRRLGGGEAADDEVREQRRVERKSRRQRQKEARERDQRELKFLRSRNEQVERQLGDINRRLQASETASVDGRIAQLDRAIESAEDVYAKAIDAGEGKDAAEAQRIRDSLRDQRSYLQQWKQQGGSQVQAEPEVDPRLVENVRDWHGRNQWFDFGRRDEDSAIAGAIDDMMVRDGFDPTTPEYYDELDKRIARRLPHLAKGGGRGNNADDYDDDAGGDAGERGGDKPSGGPRFRVGGKERALRSNEVHISRERREAMEEAGVWEDPVLRKKYLKRYAEWDRENASNA